jgi:adenosylcobinamide-GDP ribazoletransferase
MASVLGAIGLLTRIPVRLADPDRPGAAAFGIVGAGVGVVAAVPLALFGSLGEPWLAAIGALTAMVVTTGALHLDGLADTADALLARDREAAERARKDPAAGPGGVIALILALAAEGAALASLVATGGTAIAAASLIAVVSVSRVVPVVAVRAIHVGGTKDGSAPAGGLSGWFGARVTTFDAAVALASVVLVVAVAAFAAARLGASGTGVSSTDVTWIVVGGAAGAFVVGLLTTAAIVGARDGLDGDGMGGSIEVATIAGLVAAAVLAR